LVTHFYQLVAYHDCQMGVSLMLLLPHTGEYVP
jgi:hypothetical protein